MGFLPYILGTIAIIVGLRTVFTQEATLTIQLWGNSSNNPHDGGGQGYSTSEHTGFIAVLIGIAQIAIGAALILEGPAFLNRG